MSLNIRHFAVLPCWTRVTKWSADVPGGDGQCHYPAQYFMYVCVCVCVCVCVWGWWWVVSLEKRCTNSTAIRWFTWQCYLSYIPLCNLSSIFNFTFPKFRSAASLLGLAGEHCAACSFSPEFPVKTTCYVEQCNFIFKRVSVNFLNWYFSLLYFLFRVLWNELQILSALKMRYSLYCVFYH